MKITEVSITVTREKISNPGSLEETWMELQSDSECKFFLSWHWIGPWLEQIVNFADVYLIRIVQGDKTIGLCTFLDIKKWNYFYRSRNIYFNEFPAHPYNMVIEYNSPLLRKGYESSATRALLNWFVSECSDWEEINLNAIDAKSGFYKYLNSELLCRLEITPLRHEQVNIFNRGNSGGSIDNYLSSNRRYQLRRTMRMYEKEHNSPVEFHVAENSEEALAYFREMGVLHTAYWKSKGRAGSFANSLWVNFHEKIISSPSSSRFVRIIKFCCGDYTIGYLYNFLWRDEMMNVQSGFHYSRDAKFKPGYIAHYLAMGYALENGCHSYNYLAGDAQYKRSLSNHKDNLVWLRIRKPLLKFRILYRGIRKTFKQGKHPDNAGLDAYQCCNRAIVLASGINGLGAVKSLHKAGISVIAVANSENDLAAKSNTVSSLHIIRDGPGWEAEVLKLIRETAGTSRPAIIACSDRGGNLLADYQDEIRKYCTFLTPDPVILRSLNDKKDEIEFLKSHNIPLPESISSLDAGGLRSLRLPVIIKPRTYEGYSIINAKNIIIEDTGQREAFTRAYGEILDKFIAQEIISGPDTNLWVCNATFDQHSRLFCAFTFRRLGTSPSHFGVTSLASSEYNPRIIEISERLGAIFNYRGPVMFEFKYDPASDDYLYIETNPRLGMCNWFDTLCGVNNVAVSCALSQNGEFFIPTIQKQNIYYWNFYSDMIARIENRENPLSVLKLYMKLAPEKKIWAIYSFPDFKPFIYSSIYNFKSMFLRTIKYFSRKKSMFSD